MILIFSRNDDNSTKEICLWLKHLKKKYLVVYHHTLFELVELTDDFNFKFKLNNTIYTINQFTTIWFRRGWFQFKYIDLSPLKNSLLKDHINHIEDHIKDEYKIAYEHMYHHLSEKPNVFGNVLNSATLIK